MLVKREFDVEKPESFMAKAKNFLVSSGWAITRERSGDLGARRYVHAIFGEKLMDKKKLIEWFITVKARPEGVEIGIDVPVYLEWDYARKKLGEKIEELFSQIV